MCVDKVFVADLSEMIFSISVIVFKHKQKKLAQHRKKNNNNNNMEMVTEPLFPTNKGTSQEE